MSFKRTKIGHVRLTAISIAVAALLAVPLGAVLTSEEASDPETHVVASVQPQRAETKPGGLVAPPPLQGAEVEAPVAGTRTLDPKLQRTQDLARRPTADLLVVAKAGSQIERLTAINVLWVRRERAEAERLAEGDRVLRAKLEALRNAGR